MQNIKIDLIIDDKRQFLKYPSDIIILNLSVVMIRLTGNTYLITNDRIDTDPISVFSLKNETSSCCSC